MADLKDVLQAALGGAYTIERELGGGGMSRVFVATEKALGRHVVLKVLPGEMAGHLSIERFNREIGLAAQLQHAHIVPLLSAGQADGIPYFSMPFVRGDSLRARLAQEGALRAPVALAKGMDRIDLRVVVSQSLHKLLMRQLAKVLLLGELAEYRCRIALHVLRQREHAP